MASLTKDSAGRSPYWICCYTAADGRQLKKSTKQTDRGKANVVCMGIERAEQLAGAGGVTEAALKKIMGEILDRTTGEELVTHRADEWLAEWVEGKKDVRAESTGERYGQVVRDFKKAIGQRARLPLASITKADILKYRRAELAAGKSNKTANKAVGCLSVAFNAALRMHIIPHNPCTAVESLDEETSARDTFTSEQVQKLLEAADKLIASDPEKEEQWRDWRRAIPFAYYTGARLGDVVQTRWSMIDLKDGVIRFKPKKTKRKNVQVVVPIHPHLLPVLMAAPGVGAAFVFPVLADKDTGGVNGLSAQFSKIIKKAGIVVTITRHTTDGRQNKNLSFHSLRHSFNSELANAGVSQELRMKLTGHTKTETNTIYTHHELDVLRAAVGKIPGV